MPPTRATLAPLLLLAFVQSTTALRFFHAHHGHHGRYSASGGNPAAGTASDCPPALKFGPGPPSNCAQLPQPSDPNHLPPSDLERWFTRDMFNDLFPNANLGWGPTPSCWPYNYDSFVIAARYFPEFGTTSPNTVYTPMQNYRRDLAAFFAHAIQETGENNLALYAGINANNSAADNCFYRGGFYNWFEGGPSSSFLDPASPGYSPQDGDLCFIQGAYCGQSAELNFFYPCNLGNTTKNGTTYFEGCYFGRGAIQISYNYNYGQFQAWLATRNIIVDLLTEPNLVMTKMDPPLAILASLWFYMTPQPPKPAMHDIVVGNWNAGSVNQAAGYGGPIFGPTSLIINNECSGEDPTDPGGPGESRRIKAFKWFCLYFNVPPGNETTLSCKDMPQPFGSMQYPLSYQPDWSSTWKEQPCTCAPASYGGIIPYFDPNYYPKHFVDENPGNLQWYGVRCGTSMDNWGRCIETIYANPEMYSLNNSSSPCLSYSPNGTLSDIFN